MKTGLFIVAAFAAFSFLNVADAESCLQKLATFNNYVKEQTSCVQSLKLNESEVVSIENLKENRFNDHCLSNCSLTNLNFFKNGTILKDKVLEKLKSEASADVYEKLSKAVDECVEMASRKPSSTPRPSGEKEDKKSKDGKPKKRGFHGGRGGCKCRKAAKFMYCMFEKDKDMC